MTRILFLVLFCAIAATAVVSAQTKFSIGPEAGISVSTELNFRPVFRRHDMFLTLAYFLATN